MVDYSAISFAKTVFFDQMKVSKRFYECGGEKTLFQFENEPL